MCHICMLAGALYKLSPLWKILASLRDPKFFCLIRAISFVYWNSLTGLCTLVVEKVSIHCALGNSQWFWWDVNDCPMFRKCHILPPVGVCLGNSSNISWGDLDEMTCKFDLCDSKPLITCCWGQTPRRLVWSPCMLLSVCHVICSIVN